jgi:hypothetical protein
MKEADLLILFGVYAGIKPLKNVVIGTLCAPRGQKRPRMIGGRNKMKALSVIMPWPYLIMKQGKDVENRTWRTDYRGRILIHASKKPDPFLTEIAGRYLQDPVNLKELLQWCGHIIGSVELVDCVQNYKSKWAESGMWHWVLKNPVLFKELIPARGSLGIWDFKGELK